MSGAPFLLIFQLLGWVPEVGSRAGILPRKHLVRETMLLRAEIEGPWPESKEALIHDFNALEAF